MLVEVNYTLPCLPGLLQADTSLRLSRNVTWRPACGLQLGFDQTKKERGEKKYQSDSKNATSTKTTVSWTLDQCLSSRHLEKTSKAKTKTPRKRKKGPKKRGGRNIYKTPPSSTSHIPRLSKQENTPTHSSPDSSPDSLSLPLPSDSDSDSLSSALLACCWLSARWAPTRLAVCGDIARRASRATREALALAGRVWRALKAGLLPFPAVGPADGRYREGLVERVAAMLVVGVLVLEGCVGCRWWVLCGWWRGLDWWWLDGRLWVWVWEWEWEWEDLVLVVGVGAGWWRRGMVVVRVGLYVAERASGSFLILVSVFEDEVEGSSDRQWCVLLRRKDS